MIKPDKDIIRKESYRSISLMIKNAKIFSKKIKSKSNPIIYKKNDTS